MSRGDFLPQAGWNWHAHHNATDKPMAWIDGLDIPFQYAAESQFFEFGRDEISDEERITPARSRSERLVGPPRPDARRRPGRGPGSPLLAYRWEHTDRALADQLELEAEGYAGVVEPGHAAVRFTDPRTGADVLPTIRTEMHRVRRGAETAARPRGRLVGLPGLRRLRHRHASASEPWTVTRGDLFVVPVLAAVHHPLRGRRHRLRLRRARPVPLQRHPRLRGPAPAPPAGREGTPP